MNKKGISMANMVLIIGIISVCLYAIFQFYQTEKINRTLFSGIGATEKLASQLEKNAFLNTKEESSIIVSPTGEINGEENQNNQVVHSRGIYEAMIYAQEFGPIEKRNLYCRDKCAYYSQLIEKYSNTYGLDPVLALSLMMQESEGKLSASSDSSKGLFQINLLHCGKYGLPEDKSNCEKELTTNAEKNIEVGIKILTEFYNTYREGKVFQGCTNRNIKYTEWEAALRAYNGWGCNKKYPEQDKFVEEVMSRYKQLLGTYVEVTQTQKGLFQDNTDTFFSAEFVE